MRVQEPGFPLILRPVNGAAGLALVGGAESLLSLMLDDRISQLYCLLFAPV